MTKKNVSAKVVNNSNNIANVVENLPIVDVIDNTTTKVKVEKPNVLEDSANVLENESIKKKDTFDKIPTLFGCVSFDSEKVAKELANDLASGKISFKEFTAKISEQRKQIEKEKEKLNSLSFEDIANTIENSNLINDISLFIGTKDIKSLKKILLCDDNKLCYFHGKQSEESEKFESYKVSINGKMKVYEDTTFVSYLDYTFDNVLRSLRNYSYYLASLNRCKKQKKEENDKLQRFAELKKDLINNFGYTENDLMNL